MGGEMRGFMLFLEALLAFLILVALLVQFFLPAPNTYGIAAFVEKNDHFTAEVEAGASPSFPLYSPGDSCLALRYAPAVSAAGVVIVPYCIR